MKRYIVALLSLGALLIALGACGNESGDGGSSAQTIATERPYSLADLVGTWDYVNPKDEIYEVVIFDSNGMIISRKQGDLEITTYPSILPYYSSQFVVKPNGNSSGLETVHYFGKKFTKTWTMAFRNRTTIKGKIRMVCSFFHYDVVYTFYMNKR